MFAVDPGYSGYTKRTSTGNHDRLSFGNFETKCPFLFERICGLRSILRHYARVSGIILGVRRTNKPRSNDNVRYSNKYSACHILLSYTHYAVQCSFALKQLK